MPANKYITNSSGVLSEIRATQVSAGIVDANKIIALNSQGILDNSLVPFLLGSNFTYTQMVPSITWNIVHNLNRRPSVSVTDSAGSEVHGDVTHPNLNTTVLSFSASFSGSAYLT